MAKFIFITGGVVSGLGKGITAASIGRLLKSRGITVSIMKLDPYVNVDAGTMSPLQHGEVFVTEDGAETDLDLGHYERFIDTNLGKHFNVTTGQIYKSVITQERNGEFLGGTVQVVPHVTNEIKKSVMLAADKSGSDVLIVEIGGTVGDIESLPFLEAIRQFKSDVPRDDVIYLHVTLVPYLSMSGEQKTKPTQHSVRDLRGIGIQPNIIVCRTEYVMGADMRAKIALFCDTAPDAVVQNLDANSIYEVPLLLEEEGLGNLIVGMLRIDCGPPALGEWADVVKRIRNPKHKVRIALVGKYVGLHDAYLSVVEALNHGGISNDVEVEVEWVDSEALQDEDPLEVFAGMDGILVPGGFGYRGIEGKIDALEYARTNRIPTMAISLGMQCMLIEIGRNVLGFSGANSTEFDEECTHPMVDCLYPRNSGYDMGVPMRLGAYPCNLVPGTLAHRIYGEDVVMERHRHRFEYNNDYREQITAAGLIASGVWQQKNLVELVEHNDHPFYVGTQFHPEFRSRPNRPHPLFREFIKKALEHKLGALRA